MRLIGADIANQIVDSVPRTANEVMKKIIDDTLLKENTDPKIVVGMLTALKYCHELVLAVEGPLGDGTAVLTDFTTEVAHHYVQLLENRVHAE